MTDFYDLTDEQVLELTIEQQQRHIDILCAREGIALEFEEDPKPEAFTKKPDVPVWDVGGCYFTDQADACKVADTINAGLSRVTGEYLSGPGYEKRAVPAADAVEPRKEALWSIEGWEKHGVAHTAAATIRKQWDTNHAKAEKIRGERAGIVDEVRRRITGAAEEQQNRARWSRELLRYAELGLDPDQARAALLLAHPSAETWLPVPVPTVERSPVSLDEITVHPHTLGGQDVGSVTVGDDPSYPEDR